MKATHPFQLTGKNNRFIHSTLWRKNGSNSSKIAILLPGFLYGNDSPAMYYIRMLLVEKGYDVLNIDYRYSENFEFLQMSESDKIMYFKEEQKQIAGQLSKIDRYDEFIFTGKSLGTTAMLEMILSGVIDNIITKSRFIWLTPAEGNAEIIEYIRECSVRSLYIACESDQYLDINLIETLYECSNAECMIVPEADHLFEKTDDIYGSIENIKNIIQFIEVNFFD